MAAAKHRRAMALMSGSGEERFVSKIRALKSFSEQYKESTNAGQRKFKWKREYGRLRSERQRLEHELRAVAIGWSATVAGSGGAAELGRGAAAVLEQEEECGAARQRVASTFQSHNRQMLALLSALKRDGAGGSGSGGPSTSTSTAARASAARAQLQQLEPLEPLEPLGASQGGQRRAAAAAVAAYRSNDAASKLEQLLADATSAQAFLMSSALMEVDSASSAVQRARELVRVEVLAHATDGVDGLDALVDALDGVGARACHDPLLRQDIVHQLSAAFAEHGGRLDGVATQLAHDLAAIDLETPRDEEPWSAEARGRFTVLCKEHGIEAARSNAGVSERELLDELRLAFPARGGGALRRQLTRARASRRARRSRSALRAQWEREFGERLDDARVRFERAASAEAQMFAAEATRRDALRAQTALHGRVVALNAERGRAEAAQRAAAATLELRAGIARGIEEGRASEAAQITREAVGDFRREAEARRAAETEVARRVAVADAAEREALGVVNAARVEYRHSVLDEKERLKQTVLLEEELARAKQERALETLARSVPYAARLDELAQTRDPQRLLDETVAYRSAVEATSEQVQYRQTGFDDAKLFRDPRFLLATTLHEAGLYRSAYANDVLTAMAPPREARTFV